MCIIGIFKLINVQMRSQCLTSASLFDMVLIYEFKSKERDKNTTELKERR